MGDIKIYLYNEYESKYILNFQKDEIETLNFNKIKEKFQKNFCINLNDYSFSYKKDINSPFDENNIEKLIEQGIIFKSKNNIIEYGKQIDNLKKEINELQNELKYINKKKHDEIIKLSALKYEKDNWEKKVKNNIDNAVKEQIKLDKITNELVTINELKNEEQKKYDEIKKNISEKSNIYEQLEKVIEEKTEITRILDDNVIENNFKLNQYDEKKKKFEEEMNKKKNEYIDLFRRIKETNSFYLDKEKNFETQMMNKENYKKTIEEKKLKIQNNIKKNIEKYINSLEQNFLGEIKNKCLQNLKLHINKLESYEKKRNNTFEKEKKFYEKTKYELIGLAKLNNFVHHGKICNKCYKNPIKGILYKCCVCNDYNLCEKCEEINFLYGNHPHHFIKIRKKLLNNEIDSNNMKIINKNKINNNQNDYPLLEFENKEIFELKEQLNKINIKNNNKFQLSIQSNLKLYIKGKNEIKNNKNKQSILNIQSNIINIIINGKKKINIKKSEKKKDENKLFKNENFQIISNKVKIFHLFQKQYENNFTLNSKNIDKHNNSNLINNTEEKKRMQNLINNEEKEINQKNSISEVYDINEIRSDEINIKNEDGQILNEGIKRIKSNSSQNYETNKSNYTNYFFSFENKKGHYDNQNTNDYSCEYIFDGSRIFSKNDENKIIKFTIINNGNNKWVENETFLKIKCKNNLLDKNIIKLNSLQSNEKQKIEIPLVKNNFLSLGRYNIEIEFVVKEKQYGNSKTFTFEIQ